MFHLLNFVSPAFTRRGWMLSSHLSSTAPALKSSCSHLTNTEHTSTPEQMSGAGVLIFKLMFLKTGLAKILSWGKNPLSMIEAKIFTNNWIGCNLNQSVCVCGWIFIWSHPGSEKYMAIRNSVRLKEVPTGFFFFFLVFSEWEVSKTKG